MKHQRVVVTEHGGPEVLQVLEEDLPEPMAGEVRVRVLAAGVSSYDLYAPAIRPPARGSESAVQAGRGCRRSC